MTKVMLTSVLQPGEAAGLESCEKAPWGHRFSPRNEGHLRGFGEDLVKYPRRLNLAAQVKKMIWIWPGDALEPEREFWTSHVLFGMQAV